MGATALLCHPAAARGPHGGDRVQRRRRGRARRRRLHRPRARRAPSARGDQAAAAGDRPGRRRGQRPGGHRGDRLRGRVPCGARDARRRRGRARRHRARAADRSDGRPDASHRGGGGRRAAGRRGAQPAGGGPACRRAGRQGSLLCLPGGGGPRAVPRRQVRAVACDAAPDRARVPRRGRGAGEEDRARVPRRAARWRPAAAVSGRGPARGVPDTPDTGRRRARCGHRGHHRGGRRIPGLARRRHRRPDVRAARGARSRRYCHRWARHQCRPPGSRR